MNKAQEFTNYVSYAALGALKTILGIIVTISAVLNLTSGLIGGIWLAIIGHWGSIVIGIILAIAMPWAYTILFLLTVGFAILISFFYERGSKAFVGIFGFLSLIYGSAIIAAWVIFVFRYFMGDADKSSYIPLLFWSHATATAPLYYMASKESPDDSTTTLALIFGQICYFICVLYFFLGDSPTPWLYSIVAIGLALSAYSTIMALNEMIQEEKVKKAFCENGDYEDFMPQPNPDNLMQGGDYEGAIDSYRLLLEENPDDIAAWNNLGYCLNRRDDYQGAIECFDKALEINRYDTYSWYFKGICLYKLGDYSGAQSCYEKAIEIEPESPALWYNKALAEDLLEDCGMAAKSFEKFLTIAPENAEEQIDYARERLKELNAS